MGLNMVQLGECEQGMKRRTGRREVGWSWRCGPSLANQIGPVYKFPRVQYDPKTVDTTTKAKNPLLSDLLAVLKRPASIDFLQLVYTTAIREFGFQGLIPQHSSVILLSR